MPRPPIQHHKFIIQLSDSLEEQVREATEVGKLAVVLRPVVATLGNPVAFPILFGLIGLGIGLYVLTRLFPPKADVTNLLDLRKTAEQIAEIIHSPLPNIPGVADLEEVRRNLVRGTTQLLRKMWDGLQKLPPIL